ncbi:hypothetical protein PC129_g16779 [Phytophthora cactorum]|uniref:RxLR effector protein n=1 Tax=Phytophthora cactorum TaxID=29920 RepID=A0A329RJC1_9STRA|nr:hypothetical protein Pcac1_g13273 [Phytophthora cactorum]KAG2802922.1 hypothetical protein PC112_g19417 [Phytophthora cactorum]KAG2851394.1 hypothetical protein PC113_g15961 [Phytophthora cactorum]KAG2887582.1 hypothetical protein PC114_g18774 [Phytophthora cactorum]KAG2903039.1 hypothetical protein PC117_g21339 [Phytophthora cactorum]
MRFIFFLALLRAFSTVNGLSFTDTNETAPIASIAGASKTKGIDSSNKVNRLRGTQKSDDEERIYVPIRPGYLSSTSTAAKPSRLDSGRLSPCIHEVDKTPLSPKAEL